MPESYEREPLADARCKEGEQRRRWLMRPIALAVFAAVLTFLVLAAPTAAGGCVNTSMLLEGTSPDVQIGR
jgi:hypothetical protein